MKQELWDNLIDCGYATEEELITITNLNGYSMETLEDVLYSKTGYHYWGQWDE